MLTLYVYPPSGNGYKVRLLLRLLGLPYQYGEVDILAGATHTDEFLSRNPAGKIPMLLLEDGRSLPESGAILFYLAENTPFLPEDTFDRAQVLRWIFFEQYSHEPYIAVARFWRSIAGMTPEREAALPEKMERGYAALDVMEKHLRDHDCFVGQRCSIADIALYAYTHVAPEGGFDLTGYPAINGWMERISALPGYATIDAG